jgi:hypothetical protein
MSKRNKARLLKLVQLLVSVLPLIALIIVNWEVYTKTPASTASLGFGMVIAIVFAVLKLLGRLPKNIKGVVWAGIVCVMCWCLKILIVDLPIISTAWFMGSLLAEFFTPMIKKAEKESNIEEQATVTAEEVAAKISSMIGGGGRV